MQGESTKSVPVTDRHNQSSLGGENDTMSQTPGIRRQWPITFPRIRDHYKPINPTVNEPIILRYSAKALFNTDCENLTFGKYKHFDESIKKRKGGIVKSPTQVSLFPTVKRGYPEKSQSVNSPTANVHSSLMVGQASRLPAISSKKNQPSSLGATDSTAANGRAKPSTEQTVELTPKKGRDWSAEDQKKQVLLADGRKRLFNRFPEIKTVFPRQHVPTNYLRESVEYECV